MVSIRHRKAVISSQICSIQTLGAAYGGNPRSQSVKPLQRDQTLSMIACHDAHKSEPSALCLPSVQIPHGHIIFDCYFDNPKGLHRSTGQVIGAAGLNVMLCNSSCPHRSRVCAEGRRRHRRSPTKCHCPASSTCGELPLPSSVMRPIVKKVVDLGRDLGSTAPELLPFTDTAPFCSMMLQFGAVEQRPRYSRTIASVLRRVRHLRRAPSRHPGAASTSIAEWDVPLGPVKCGGAPSRPPA